MSEIVQEFQESESCFISNYIVYSKPYTQWISLDTRGHICVTIKVPRAFYHAKI